MLGNNWSALLEGVTLDLQDIDSFGSCVYSSPRAFPTVETDMGQEEINV